MKVPHSTWFHAKPASVHVEGRGGGCHVTASHFPTKTRAHRVARTGFRVPEVVTGQEGSDQEQCRRDVLSLSHA